MRDWYDQTTLVDMHLREIRAAVAKDRLARQARRAHGQPPLRRRVGRMLISAGEALVG